MKIAILSNGPGNYSTKRLKEVAKNRGHGVKVIKYRECYASIEKNNPTISYRGEDLAQFDAIIPRIANSMTKYGTAMLRQLEMGCLYCFEFDSYKPQPRQTSQHAAACKGGCRDSKNSV